MPVLNYVKCIAKPNLVAMALPKTASILEHRIAPRWLLLASMYLVVFVLTSPRAVAQSCTGTGEGGCQQISCPNGGTTSVSGTVYAPNGADPLPNVLVYVPTTSLTEFTDGVSVTNPLLDDEANLVSGSPLVQTTTAVNGTFTLTSVPPGSDIPIVIQAGRWRREFVISSVASCTNTPLTTVTQGGFSSLGGYGESTSVRFAQTQSEGDVPKMALATGKADALECTLRKVGIADTEFTDYTMNVSSGGSGPGRVNLFEGSGDSGVKAGSTVHTEATLVGSVSSTFTGSLLGGYNVLLFPCQGDSNNYTTADGRNNVIAFTGAGGRLFATHHSAFYINENSPIDTAVNWTADTSLSDGAATINTSFTSGNTLAQWLQDIGATTTLGQVTLNNNFNDQSGVNAPTESWATLNSDSDVMQLSFYTPVGQSSSNQFGRVMFNEYHVDNTTTSSSVTFPNECTGTLAKTSAMSAQEHMLEYSLFDLMNFAVPVVTTDVSIVITTTPSTFTGGDQDDTIDVTVTNNGTAAIATSPAVTLAVTIPAGLTAVSMTDPLGNWNCSVSTLTCTLLNPLAASATNSITLAVSVAANVSAGSASLGATVSSTDFAASTSGNVSLNVDVAPAGTVTGPIETTTTPATNVGSTATSAATLTFAVSAGTTISSISVVTEGFTGKDFTNAANGTCAAQNYESAATCTVIVNFSPLYPGLRMGAVEILGGSGEGNSLLETAYISGIGQGPEAIFQPGAQSTVASESGSDNFEDAAVDILGNVYVIDYPNHQVLKETLSSGSYTQSALFTSLSGPKGIAIDGAGNIYIADSVSNNVYKETLINGSYTQSTVASELNGPGGVAVDASGNVYIADSGNGRVLLETLSGATYIQSVIASGLSNPARVAVDAAGNVYVTDTGNDQVLLETLSNGTYTQSTIVTGLTSPQGVAIDGNETIYIADTGNNRIVEEQVISESYVQTVLVSGLNTPYSVVVDELGNLYIADFGDNHVFKQDYSDPPSLSFASTVVNTTSSDSPKTETLVNFGNAALTAVSPGITAPTDFPQVTGNSTDCTTSFSLAAAAGCTLRIDFHPLSTGSLSESFVLTDNNLNNAPVTQTLAVSGTGNSAVSIVLSPSSLPTPVIGTAYSQTISASGGTGPYTFTVSSGTLPAGLSLSTGGVLSGTPTAVGSSTFTIQATDANSVTGTQSYSTTIAAPTITVSPGSLPNATYASSYSQTISASGGSGTYTYAVSAGSVPAGLSLNSITGVLSGTPTSVAPATFTVTATDTVTTGSGAPYTGSQAYSLVVGKATATVTLGSLSQTYTGAPLPATATTAPSGLTVDFTYNGSSTAPTTAGTYTVVGTVSDPNYQGTATGALVISKATPTITWANPAAITYGIALSATQLNASVTGEIEASFVYTPASGTVLNAGASQTLSVTFTPTDTTDYNNATQTVQITVNKATPVITWANPATITYGTALSATQLNATSATAGTFVYTPSAGTVLNAGASQTLSVTLTPTDTTDYNNATQTVQITVNKATPVIAWANPATITYGTALSATQLNATSATAGTFVYTPSAGTVLNAGASQTLSVTFTPTDTTDYNNATQAVQITVNKATPTLTWANPAAITYGTALSATQLNASVTGEIAGAFVYTPASGTVLNAGASQTLSVTFTPTDTTDYNNATQAVQITVNKATPTLAWSNPAAITYGTALSAAQLNATSAIAGTFVYTPASGTVLNAGASQTLSVTFTPTDTTDYNNATQTVQITVNKATPVISWSNPLAIAYGTALSATQLNASTSTAGTFVYTPTAGTVLTAGANQTLSVTLTPTDTTDYNSATQTVQITVNKATPVITWSNPLAIAYGTALSATQLNASTSTAGTFVYTPTAGTVLNAGANQTLSVTFTPTDATDYNDATQTVQITVNKVQPVLTWMNPAAITYGTALSATQLNASVAGEIAGTFVYTPAAGTMLNAGANQTLSVTFTPTNATNYATTIQTVQISVNQAIPTAVLMTSANPALSESPVEFTATISSPAGIPTGNVSFMNGTMLLGSSALSNGVATLTTSSLATGSDPITAVYSGDTNFAPTSSSVLAQVVINFAVNPVSGSGGTSSGGSGTSQTVNPGGTATFTIAIVPTSGTTFPTITDLTVTGLPPGATATLSTSGWTQLTSTSWSYPAFAQLSDVSLSFYVPATSASVSNQAAVPSNMSGKLPSALAALFLVPFSFFLFGPRKQKTWAVSLLFLIVGLVTMTSLTACGTRNGFFAQQEKSYIVTVTVTTGAVSHSTTVTLNVE